MSNVILKKRGRKPKKTIEEQEKNIAPENIIIPICEENIQINIEENDNFKNNDSSHNDLENDNLDHNDLENDNLDNQNNGDIKPANKKRGRKPKGGKIIQQIIPTNLNKESKPNIILHLKCSFKDLNSINVSGPNIDGFSFSNNNNFSSYDKFNSENIDKIINQSLEKDYELDDNYDCGKKENDIRDVWKKLKVLEHYLHINNNYNKKSACFWDTCEFDNPPIYIPKYFMKNSYHVYGCFCSPECAAAHLMNEPIDTSTKFERYYLLNSIYGKIYGYNKNIKPAPNPYYMLEKYYGNLNIQEYRALLQNERLFLVVDKPLTRIMPELHEDNDDFLINNKIIPSNSYQNKKTLIKKQTKTNILSEQFGLVN
jgi:hypothetical protein